MSKADSLDSRGSGKSWCWPKGARPLGTRICTAKRLSVPFGLEYDVKVEEATQDVVLVLKGSAEERMESEESIHPRKRRLEPPSVRLILVYPSA